MPRTFAAGFHSFAESVNEKHCCCCCCVESVVVSVCNVAVAVVAGAVAWPILSFFGGMQIDDAVADVAAHTVVAGRIAVVGDWSGMAQRLHALLLEWLNEKEKKR